MQIHELTNDQMNAILAAKLVEHDPTVSFETAFAATRSLVDVARERLKAESIGELGVRPTFTGATIGSQLCNHAGGGCDCAEH